MATVVLHSCEESRQEKGKGEQTLGIHLSFISTKNTLGRAIKTKLEEGDATIIL